MISIRFCTILFTVADCDLVLSALPQWRTTAPPDSCAVWYCRVRKLSFFFCSWRAKNVALLRLTSMVFLFFTPLPPLTRPLTKFVPFSGSLDHLGCHQVSACKSLSCGLNCMLNGETYQHVRTLRNHRHERSLSIRVLQQSFWADSWIYWRTFNRPTCRSSHKLPSTFHHTYWTRSPVLYST